MAEIKFSCGCGQHISCDDAWAGHQIQCPACQNNIVVPQAQAPAAAPAPNYSKQPLQTANSPKLSAGLTQVTRPKAPAVAPQRRPVRPPKTANPAIKFAATAIVLLAVGVAALVYLPGLLKSTSDTGGSAKTSAQSAGSGAGGAGPLGEMNGAMDVSDALDGGSQSRPRPVQPRPAATPGTNNAARTKPR